MDSCSGLTHFTTYTRVARVARWIGGWARDGTQVRRWVVIGIMRLWAQSDRMLSIGDGWTHVRVPKVCPKKEKM